MDLDRRWEDEAVLETANNPMLRMKAGRGEVLTSSVLSQPKLPRVGDEIDSN